MLVILLVNINDTAANTIILENTEDIVFFSYYYYRLDEIIII